MSEARSVIVRRVILWVPACALMAAIFFVSALPAGEVLQVRIWDKALHFTVYGLLGLLFLLPLSEGRWSRITARSARLAVLCTLLYGIADEIHQMATPGRTPDVRDIVADTLGAAAAVGLLVLLRVMVSGRRGYTAS